MEFHQKQLSKGLVGSDVFCFSIACVDDSSTTFSSTFVVHVNDVVACYRGKAKMPEALWKLFQHEHIIWTNCNISTDLFKSFNNGVFFHCLHVEMATLFEEAFRKDWSGFDKSGKARPSGALAMFENARLRRKT